MRSIFQKSNKKKAIERSKTNLHTIKNDNVHTYSKFVKWHLKIKVRFSCEQKNCEFPSAKFLFSFPFYFLENVNTQ